MKVKSLNSLYLPKKIIEKRKEKRIDLSEIEKNQGILPFSYEYVSGYHIPVIANLKEKKTNADFILGIIGEPNMEVTYHGCVPNKKVYGTIKEQDKSKVDYYFFYTHDEDFNINEIFIFDMETKNLNVFNKDGELIRNHKKEEIQAIKNYKTDSTSVTKKLREDINWQKDPQSIKKTYITIETLTNMFNDSMKHEINSEDKKLFRAMHIPLSQIGNVGDIFTDKSFCSTSTTTAVPKDFFDKKKKMPIMIIDFPKGAKFVDMDAMYNILRMEYKEDEYLLNRDSRFLITKIDKKNCLVEAKYLLTEEEKAGLNEN